MSISYGKTPDASASTEQKNISIPLYVGGAVAQLAGLTAIAYQLSEPTFAYFTMLLTVVGLTCAYFLRRFGGSSRLIQGGAAVVALVFIGAVRGVGPFQNLVPYEAQGSQELLLVCALAFTATFCSFLLVTDESVMFTCVWAIAIIGLTGTVNINQELIVCFGVFLIAATFLLVHQNSLAGGMQTITESTLAGDDDAPVAVGRARHTVTARARWGLLQTQAGVALACAAGAVLLGVLIAIPLQMVGRNLSLATVIQRLNVPTAAAQQLTGGNGVFQLNFDNATDFEVGLGPVADDQTERARVESPKPLYWRGRVFDRYGGKGWQSSFIQSGRGGFAPVQDSRQMEPSGRTNADGTNTFRIPAPAYPRRKIDTVTYRFHMTNQGSTRLAPLYVAAEARRLRLPAAQVVLRPDNTMSVPNVWGPDYEVESDVATSVKPSDQRGTTQVGYPVDVRRLYLGFPASDPLDTLAEQIIAKANARNPYDKAEALRQWVSTNCVYTLEAPAVPRGRDAAEYFLMESKQGYCDLYATAFTILCRHAGLPARIATGFAPGVEIEDVSPRTFRLREADRHAWTEVYFEGYGWIVFDATQDTPGTIAPARTPKPEPDERTLLERIFAAGWLPVTLTVAGFGGFMYFVIMEITLLWRGRGAASPIHAVPANARQVVRLYEQGARKLARRGVRRAPESTTTDYLNAARARLGESVYMAFVPLTALFQKAVYGAGSQSPVDTADTAAAHAALQNLTRALKEKPDAHRKK